MNRTWLSFLLPALVLGVVVLFLARQFPDAIADPQERDSLIAAMVWALLPLSALVVMLRGRPRAVFSAAAIWIGIGAALLVAYAFRYQAETLGRRMFWPS